MNGLGQIQNLTVDQVFKSLGSSWEGLDATEAADRLLEVGRNSIEVSDPWRQLHSLLRQLTNFFTILLFTSAAICFIAERLQPGQSMNVLGWALGGVALLNALFSFIQEYRAEKAMEALRHFLPQRVEVLRNGHPDTFLAEELVPGDLLLLKEGDRVPADARLVETKEITVNNAPLTGEAQPVSLTTDPVNSRLLESANIAFAGSLVLRGSGKALVFSTGLRTEFGKLAHLSQAIRRERSPLERQTSHMVRVLTIIAVSLGLSFFLYGMFSGRSLWVNLVFMMGIIVANVPEGLLPTFTLALAMGSLRMARKNVLVTSLNAVEALGAVEVICTDKTGTLTLNQLEVTKLVRYASGMEVIAPEERRQMLELTLFASEIHHTESGFGGDPLDVAIANSLLLCGENPDHAVQRQQQYYAFNVEKKRSSGIGMDGDQAIFVVKGAWEIIKPMLVGVVTLGGGEIPAGNDELDQAEKHMEALASGGLRVIAVAYRHLSAVEKGDIPPEKLEQELLLAGFIGIEDPLRQGVTSALASCHTAGIEVLLITGDHPDTAMNIAARCGIINAADSNEVVMTGDVLEGLSENALEEAIDAGVRIFARTGPAQKMKIIMALKNQEKVVAMTGDGVNDAPALKAADVGIAMGRSGTDVARASAQIVLLDDNFASIVAGIEEGRTVFMNIRKFTNYVLVSNGPEILPYLIYILLPVPLALTVIQILTIDLGTDIIPSMALGQEPPDPDAMRQPPRGREFRLLSLGLVTHSYLFLGLLEALWSLALFFYVLVDGGWSYGMDLAADDLTYRSATGIALATILLMQVGNLVGRRYARNSGIDKGLLRNHLMVAGILIQVIFSWALLYLPPVQQVLGTGPVSLPIYLTAWLGVPLIFGADFLRKKLMFRS